PLMEITMRNLMSTANSGAIDVHDFLARADVLAACGMTVLISDYFEYYRLAAYLGRHTKKQIGVVMGAGSLKDLFEEQYYGNLDGGILESFGRLFKNDLKLYVYPLLDRTTNALTTVQNLAVAPKLRKLYDYLVDSGSIEQLDGFHEEYLSIFSREILKKIKIGDSTWESMVPLGVAEVIKRQSFFDYRAS
ncbi:MAG: TonB-dependent receptor, partial [Candidatus Binatia bacterium]